MSCLICPPDTGCNLFEMLPFSAGLAAFRAGRWGAPPYPREFIRRNGQNHWLAQNQRTGPAERRVRPTQCGGYTLRAGFLSGQDLVATRRPIVGRRSTDAPDLSALRYARTTTTAAPPVQAWPCINCRQLVYGVLCPRCHVPPRPHVQRAAVDRRHLRKATVRAGRRNNEGHYPFREPTAADRFDARFAAELQRRWLAVELSASYRAIHLDSGAYINAADRLTALLRAPERGAP